MEDSNLVYIPYRATALIPISAQLNEVISTEFYQSAALFKDDLSTLDTLRTKIIDIFNTNSADVDRDLPILQNYYSQICYIERKFPRDSVEFTWFSNNLTYQPNSKISLKSFQFERLNLLYNIALLFSQVAFRQDRSDLEGLRSCSLYLQNAAGVLQLILDYIPHIGDFKIPIEYSPEAITALQYLMLAQAQELYWQRAISSSSDKIVAILSQQVGVFYKLSFDNFHKSQFILRSEFLNHINCKSQHFLAATHYRMAQHEYALSKYGDQVAHLKQANIYSSKGLKSLKGVSEVVVDDIRNLDNVIKTTLKSAEKENDLIYHKNVPTTLTPVDGRLMVKPVLLQDIDNPIKYLRLQKSKLLFENLLPYLVIQSAQLFKERQEEFVLSNLINPIKTLTKILQTHISERDLPLSLDSLTKPQRLPESLMQHCHDLFSNDALTNLQKSLKELSKLSIESRRLIDGCKERLEIESDEDHLHRQRQGSRRWTRLSSQEASAELTDKITQYEQYLLQASNGDDTIRHNVKEIKPYLELMTNLAIPGDSSYRDKLAKFIPMSGLVEVSAELQSIIKQLKDVLSESASEINKRLHFIELVELKSREMSILPKIISEYRLLQSNENLVISEETFEPVFTKHMKNFDNDLNNLYKIRDEQSELEQKIDSLNKKFVIASSSTAEISTARKEALQTLDDAYNGYRENLENIKEGLNFYNGFCSNVQDLLQKCDDFVYQRRLEAKELELKLEGQRMPQTPIKSKTVAPPTSISQQRYKTTFSDDEEDTSFYTDDNNDDSFEQNTLFVSSDGSKSPLKQKRMNNGDRQPTKALDLTPVARRKKQNDDDEEEAKRKTFWDLSKHGIQFD